MTGSKICSAIFFYIVMLGCDSDDNGAVDQDAELSVTEQNFKGDWLRTAYFVSQPNDSLGTMPPSEDLFQALEDCLKDDAVRYTVGSGADENKYLLGIQEKACDGQDPGTFIEIGRWLLTDGNGLSISYSDVTERFVITSLTKQSVLIRRRSGIKTDDGVVYTFQGYERLE